MKLMKIACMRAVLVLCLVVAFGLIGCAGKGAPEKTNCDAKITWQVTKEAKLTQFDCAVGMNAGQPSLIFTVGVENAADKPYRFRLNIFLEDIEKAFGYLVPAKGNPPVLEPGKGATVKIPFIGTGQESKKILVIVETISVD
ncbi:MAG: hypothetical protein V2I56_12560 [Desulfobacteraceae bacterium]|jgi:hypothetical protein|nr:hypothetical protein [Desulfobacteraceae bacterium]